MKEPAESEREIHGLRPANKYFIQITPIADNFTGNTFFIFNNRRSTLVENYEFFESNCSKV